MDRRKNQRAILFGTGVFRDGFRTFAHGVLRQFTGQQKTHGRLDLATRDRRTFVVMGETRSFGGYTFENIVDEAVHYAHRLAGYTSVGMHLLQHFVYVDGVTLLPAAFLLFVSLGDVLLCLSGFFGGLTASFWRHLVVKRQL